jgi:anaerobic sulfite reductase subunit B
MAVEPLLFSPGPMVPEPYIVRSRGRETADTWTIELEPRAGEMIDAEAGQFAMLTAYGVGEVPISFSGRGADGSLVHTIRDVGAVTAELCRIPRGGTIGVRGPFGTTWPLEEARGADVVVLAGGLGLAPLRPAVEGLLARRDSYGRLLLLYGARTPGDLLYPQQLEDWRAEGLDVRMTVDAGTRSWLDRVGFVSALLDDVTVDFESAVALVCGPEVMMRVTVGALLQRGISAERTYVSLERSMSCGIGHCGHCQLGPILICRDGPVLTWDEVARWLAVREL